MMRSEREKNLRHMCLAGILLGVSVCLSFIESAFPPLPFLPPGVKLGTSNIIVMFTLLFMGKKWGFSVAFMKSLFVLFLRGPTAFFLSLSGGMLSLVSIILLSRIKDLSLVFLSIGGAAAHNLGQLAAAFILMKNGYVWYYLPILVLCGIVTGTVTGITIKVIMPSLLKAGRHFK